MGSGSNMGGKIATTPGGRKQAKCFIGGEERRRAMSGLPLHLYRW